MTNTSFAPPPRAEWPSAASEVLRLMSKALRHRSKERAQMHVALHRSSKVADNEVYVAQKLRDGLHAAIHIEDPYAEHVIKGWVLFSPTRFSGSSVNLALPYMPFTYRYAKRTHTYTASNSQNWADAHAPTAAWQAFTAALTDGLLKSAPVPDDTWARAGPLFSTNEVRSMFDRVKARQSSPQRSPWKLKYQQLAAAHPQLRPRLRELRDPFAVSGNATAGGKKLFAQHPRKSEIERMVQYWTLSEGYGDVQRFRRSGPAALAGKSNANRTGTLKLDYAMALYMSKFAPRAPQLPPKMRNVATGSATPVLYRGVRMTRAELGAFLKRGDHADKGFMAFTRNPAYAAGFVMSRPTNANDVAVVFRLSTADVQRGTPWIWFASSREATGNAPKNLHDKNYPQPQLPLAIRGGRPPDPYRAKRPLAFNRTFLSSTLPSEYEVVLPPGTLRVLSRKVTQSSVPGYKQQVLHIDVGFAPDRAATSLWTGSARGGTRTVRIV